MSIFRYHSKHKIIVGVLILSYAAYHFTGKRKEQTYYDNGNTLQSGSIKEGKNHGQWIWYYPNGKKKLEGSFNNGAREGVWKTYNENGKILTESHYLNDKLNGKYSIWDNEGNLVKEMNYINDMITESDKSNP
ncbi:MAG: hypothetical protein IT232_07160 [Flavobacteriales bacterium]|nr:hypothetical protein [Flavobacteriales bacterium]